jgi:hypothetical protein
MSVILLTHIFMSKQYESHIRYFVDALLAAAFLAAAPVFEPKAGVISQLENANLEVNLPKLLRLHC